MTRKRGAAASFLRATSNAATPRAAVQTGCYSVDGGKWERDVRGVQHRIEHSARVEREYRCRSRNTWSTAGASFRLVKDSTSVNELSYLDLVTKYCANSYPIPACDHHVAQYAKRRHQQGHHGSEYEVAMVHAAANGDG